MDVAAILAFRLDRSGLAARRAPDLAAAAACPASDFSHDAALLALGARANDVTREAFDAAVDDGSLVVAHVVRGAIHAVAPGDHALWGRALLAADDTELGAQLGTRMRGLAAEHGFAPTAALDEVTTAATEALEDAGALDKVALHAALRQRVSPALMPWCRGCGSHHVAPMLWRYATVRAGVRLDAQRRYRPGAPGRTPEATEAVRRFLAVYGPATPADLAAWAGIGSSHARRLWDAVAGDLAEIAVGDRTAWLLRGDRRALESPPDAKGVRLLPPGDPYLQTPNRPLLAPDRAVRKRLFRPVASPGAVLRDGRLAGLWRARSGRRKLELTVEPLARLRRADLEDEAGRVAALRGAADVTVAVG